MIGIYSLWWEQNQKIYIGQSIDCNSRYTEHLRLLRNNEHYNYKVQNNYNLYGAPEFNILEECTISTLDTIEKSWIKEYNAIVDGLNITEGGNSGRGDKSSGAKYSRATILKAFSLLYRTSLTHAEISKRVKMDARGIGGISQGLYHLNLMEEYPAQYEQMKNNRALVNKANTRKLDPTKVYPIVLDPQGNECLVTTSVREFCRTHPLLNIRGVSGMLELLRGERHSHLGFKLKDPTKTTLTVDINRPSIIGPDGTVYSGIKNIAEFCRNTAILKDSNNSANGISKVFRGACSHYKGFKLLIEEKTLP